ncbi:MAG: hypothetical protein NC114_06330 [Ruminococcus flavefaciens]|nr:hypothetical protein [Ruminococcus flavefaciens]
MAMDPKVDKLCESCSNNQGNCMYGYPSGVQGCDRGMTPEAILLMQKEQRKYCATHPEIRTVACGSCKVKDVCHFENSRKVMYPNDTIHTIRQILKTQEIASQEAEFHPALVRIVPFTDDLPNKCEVIIKTPTGEFRFKADGEWKLNSDK